MDFQSISAFVDLVSNPERYKKALEALQSQHKAIVEQIELTGKAEEIPMLHAQAKKVVEEAQKKANSIVEKAINEAQKTADKLEKATKEVENRASIVAKSEYDLDVSWKALLEEKKNLDAASKNVLQEREIVRLDKEKIKEMQAELTDRLEKLRQVMV